MAEWRGPPRIFLLLPPWARPCGLSVNVMQLGALFIAATALSSLSRGAPSATRPAAPAAVEPAAQPGAAGSAAGPT